MAMNLVDIPRYYHQPALVRQVLDGLGVQPGGRYIDCTVGEGGHAALILDASQPGGRLLGMDADPEALRAATKRLATTSQQALVLTQNNFAHVAETAHEHGFENADGVLFDLGLSSLQLEGETRGFTFRGNQPLDMRFDPNQEMTAAAIVNSLSQETLADLLWEYGEERQSRSIARAIIQRRPMSTTEELVEAVQKATGRFRGRIHPATRTFQALRISVNQELENLQRGLEGAIQVLKPGGRLVVISYHSLEDRPVKDFIRQESHSTLVPVYKKAIRPAREEMERNRRIRSAKMRVAERL